MNIGGGNRFRQCIIPICLDRDRSS